MMYLLLYSKSIGSLHVILTTLSTRRNQSPWYESALTWNLYQSTTAPMIIPFIDISLFNVERGWIHIFLFKFSQEFWKNQRKIENCHKKCDQYKVQINFTFKTFLFSIILKGISFIKWTIFSQSTQWISIIMR